MNYRLLPGGRGGGPEPTIVLIEQGMHRLHRNAAVAVAVCVCVVGCRGFTVAAGDAAPAAPDADARGDHRAMVRADLVSSSDQAPPVPADFECATPWTKTGGPLIRNDPSRCKHRRVLVLSGAVAPPGNVRIARTQGGRLAVLFEAVEFYEESRLKLLLLDKAGREVAWSKQFSGVYMTRQGRSSDMVADPRQERLHIANLMGSSSGSEVRYRVFDLVSASLTSPHTVKPDVGQLGHVGISVASNSDVFIAHRDGDILRAHD